MISRWIAPIVALSVIFGLAGGFGEKGIAMAHANEDNQEDRLFKAGIYNTYLVLRDGIEPRTENAVRREYVDKYSEALTHVHALNQKTMELFARDQKCARFLATYREITSRLDSDLHRYLRQPDLDPETKAYLVARIHILKLFEASLFSLVLFNAEAGYSDLDQSIRRSCPVSEREYWRDQMMVAHQAATAAHLALFGQKSATNPITEHSHLSEFHRRYQTRNTGKKIGFLSTEIAASILIWEKGLQPWLASFGRVTKAAVGMAYIASWVTFDRYARENISFLKAEPKINNGQALASWGSLMSFAEEFARAEDDAAPLYSAYLKLIDQTERQRALNFLAENEWVLVDAEEKFGSVDAALKFLKEESHP